MIASFIKKQLKRTYWLLSILLFFSISSSANTDLSSKIQINAYKNSIVHFYGLKSDKNLTLLNIQGYQQTTDYTCAPAAVMSLMHYYGMLSDKDLNKTTEMRIAKEMGTSADEGTSTPQLISWLKLHGFDVQSGENGTIDMLQENLSKGVPVLVDWFDWGGHWEAVMGYNKVGKTPDEDKDTLFFADPAVHFDNIKQTSGISTINPDRFSTMWFNSKLVKGIYIVATPKKFAQNKVNTSS